MQPSFVSINPHSDENDLPLMSGGDESFSQSWILSLTEVRRSLAVGA